MVKRPAAQRGKPVAQETAEPSSDGDELELDGSDALHIDDSDEDAQVTSGSEDGEAEAGPSGSEDEEEGEEVREAMRDYMAAADQARRHEELAAARREGDGSDEEDEEEGWVHGACMDRHACMHMGFLQPSCPLLVHCPCTQLLTHHAV